MTINLTEILQSYQKFVKSTDLVINYTVNGFHDFYHVHTNIHVLCVLFSLFFLKKRTLLCFEKLLS